MTVDDLGNISIFEGHFSSEISVTETIMETEIIVIVSVSVNVGNN